VTDVLHFLPTTDDHINFLWLSERSGFRHLELVTVNTGTPGSDDVIRSCEANRKVLTAGEWVVLADQVSVSWYFLVI